MAVKTKEDKRGNKNKGIMHVPEFVLKYKVVFWCINLFLFVLFTNSDPISCPHRNVCSKPCGMTLAALAHSYFTHIRLAREGHT